MTTGQCARVLCVTQGFIRGEIEDGRLRHVRIERPRGRDILRVPIDDFRLYLRRYSSQALPRLDEFLAHAS